MIRTFWSDNVADKLYTQSGNFTSTIKTSKYVGATSTDVADISWDGTNTLWVGGGDDPPVKLYLQSGEFTSTIKDSENVSSIDSIPQGVSGDADGHTLWCGLGDDKLYYSSGRLTSTIKDSQSTTAIDVNPWGISTDNTDSPWCGSQYNKLYLQSGKFTATVKTSISMTADYDRPRGISWDGQDTYTADQNLLRKLVRFSGRFTTTVKDSQNQLELNALPTGVDYGTAAKRWEQYSEETKTFTVDVVLENNAPVPPRPPDYDPDIGIPENRMYLIVIGHEVIYFGEY